MINILLPFMGKSKFFEEYYFPKPLIEINGKTMLEHVINNYDNLANKRFTFVFSDDDCNAFHLDSTANLLTKNRKIIKLNGETSGALCTCLMAINNIDEDEPLIISNSDQVIDVDFNEVLEKFKKENADVGLIIFPSVHPRWSYAKIKNDVVLEVTEKKPISKNAIAGFYYYKKGKYFIDAAKKTLIKQINLNGNYYLSSSINELILQGKKVCFYEIDSNNYHSFYSPSKIKEYEIK